jgi:hypothetical protein
MICRKVEHFITAFRPRVKLLTVMIITLLCLIVEVVAQGGDDWLMPGHDPRNSYRTGRAGLIRSQPSLLWRLSMPGVIGTLIIADLNRDGYPEWGIVDKQGVNIYQGEQLLYTLASPFSDAQMADLAVLYDKDGNKRILCVWQRLVEDEKCGCSSVDAYLSLFSAEGTLLWSTSHAGTGIVWTFLYAENPLILIAPWGTNELIALDMDGNTQWTTLREKGLIQLAVGNLVTGPELEVLITKTTGDLQIVGSDGSLLRNWYEPLQPVLTAIGNPLPDYLMEGIMVLNPFGRLDPSSRVKVVGEGKEWASHIQEGFSPQTLALGDLNKDGVDEILVGGAVAEQGLILAISANEDRILWSASVEEAIVTMTLGDIDGTGYPEILIGTSKRLYAIDREGALLWTLAVEDGVRSMALGDVDGDGFLDILVASKETVALFGK